MPVIQILLTISILVALGWMILSWNTRRLKRLLEQEGKRLVFKKWLLFPPARVRRATIYFINYQDGSGQLFRCLLADLGGILYFRQTEKIEKPDDVSTFSQEEKDRWFYNPADLYRGE